MPQTTDGPWVKIDARTWRLSFNTSGRTGWDYDLEYRSTEPGAPSGYYLFGPGLEHGPRLQSHTAKLARYEAFWMVLRTVPFPNEMGELLVALNA